MHRGVKKASAATVAGAVTAPLVVDDKRHNPLFEVALRSNSPLAAFLREECELTGGYLGYITCQERGESTVR